MKRLSVWVINDFTWTKHLVDKVFINFTAYYWIFKHPTTIIIYGFLATRSGVCYWHKLTTRGLRLPEHPRNGKMRSSPLILSDSYFAAFYPDRPSLSPPPRSVDSTCSSRHFSLPLTFPLSSLVELRLSDFTMPCLRLPVLSCSFWHESCNKWHTSSLPKKRGKMGLRLLLQLEPDGEACSSSAAIVCLFQISSLHNSGVTAGNFAWQAELASLVLFHSRVRSWLDYAEP